MAAPVMLRNVRCSMKVSLMAVSGRPRHARPILAMILAGPRLPRSRRNAARMRLVPSSGMHRLVTLFRSERIDRAVEQAQGGIVQRMVPLASGAPRRGVLSCLRTLSSLLFHGCKQGKLSRSRPAQRVSHRKFKEKRSSTPRNHSDDASLVGEIGDRLNLCRSRPAPIAIIASTSASPSSVRRPDCSMHCARVGGLICRRPVQRETTLLIHPGRSSISSRTTISSKLRHPIRDLGLEGELQVAASSHYQFADTQPRISRISPTARPTRCCISCAKKAWERAIAARATPSNLQPKHPYSARTGHSGGSGYARLNRPIVGPEAR